MANLVYAIDSKSIFLNRKWGSNPPKRNLHTLFTFPLNFYVAVVKLADTIGLSPIIPTDVQVQLLSAIQNAHVGEWSKPAVCKTVFPKGAGVRVPPCAQNAQVVKLVDTPDLGSGAARRGGSSPPLGTKKFFEMVDTLFCF